MRDLEYLLRPKAIAVIGASNRPKSIGSVVMQNLLREGFQGVILPVNPRHTSIHGILTYPNTEKLPVKPDLSIVCTPTEVISNYMESLGKCGSKIVLIMSKDLDNSKNNILDKVKRIASKYSMRILGPDSLGVINPHIGLNATFAHTTSLKGNIAFVSQSNSLALSVLDWANSKGIGFSHFISLGDVADIDFADVIDFLGRDPYTKSILLCMDHIKTARKFISSARSTSRDKPIVVIKSASVDEISFVFPEGVTISKDLIYDASFRRAGMLRVSNFTELFDAVETMAKAKPVRGGKVAVISNGYGPAKVIKDFLLKLGGSIANVSEQTLADMKKELGEDFFSGENPFILEDHASGILYGKALKLLLKDKDVDALVVVHVPSAFTSSEDIAGNIISSIGQSRKNVFTVWLGEKDASKAREMFALANIPSYDTPDEAIKIFMDLVRFKHNQEILMETPESIPTDFIPQQRLVESLIERAIKENRSRLDEAETNEILSLYGIPVVETKVVTTVEEAVLVAKELGFPVAIKASVDEVMDKMSIGGVILDIESPEEVEKGCASIINRVKSARPDIKVRGFIVQRMYRIPDSHELFIGAFEDLLFGPVIAFGQGGVYGSISKDVTVGLPPLNMTLAKEVIQQIKILRESYASELDLDGIRLTLVQISQLIVDIPKIKTVYINPIIASRNGVKVLNAYIELHIKEQIVEERLAIKPYPKDLEEVISLPTGEKVLIRPIKPEDEPRHKDFVTSLSVEDLRMRFFTYVYGFPHQQLARWTQIDYDREMAFIAVLLENGEQKYTLGVIRAYFDPDNITAEFAIGVRSHLKGKGLGSILMDKMVRYCKQKKTKYLVGYTLNENTPMQLLAKKFSFEIRPYPDDPEVVEMKLKLS